MKDQIMALVRRGTSLLPSRRRAEVVEPEVLVEQPKQEAPRAVVPYQEPARGYNRAGEEFSGAPIELPRASCRDEAVKIYAGRIRSALQGLQKVVGSDRPLDVQMGETPSEFGCLWGEDFHWMRDVPFLWSLAIRPNGLINLHGKMYTPEIVRGVDFNLGNLVYRTLGHQETPKEDFYFWVKCNDGKNSLPGEVSSCSGAWPKILPSKGMYLRADALAKANGLDISSNCFRARLSGEVDYYNGRALLPLAHEIIPGNEFSEASIKLWTIEQVADHLITHPESEDHVARYFIRKFPRVARDYVERVGGNVGALVKEFDASLRA